jgi:hypothetical protein
VEKTLTTSNGSFSAKADTAFGVNRAYASASVFSQDWSVFASTASSWNDRWTITGGTGQAQMTVAITLTGSIIGDGQLFLYTFNFAGSPYIFLDQGNYTPGTHTTSFTFAYDTPFNVESTLGGGAQASTYYQEVSPSGTLDFYSTALLSQIILPAGASFAAESGATYPLSAVPPRRGITGAIDLLLLN